MDNNNIRQLPRIRNKEDICKNCHHSNIGSIPGSYDLRAQTILECRLNPPTNIFTKDGLNVQPLVTFDNFYCSHFQK